MRLKINFLTKQTFNRFFLLHHSKCTLLHMWEEEPSLEASVVGMPVECRELDGELKD